MATNPLVANYLRSQRAPYAGFPTAPWSGGQARPGSLMGPTDPRAFLQQGPLDFLKGFQETQQANIRQYQQTLQTYGGPLRSLLFQASPELAQASQYLQSRFQEPIPQDILQNYRTNLQSAQIARGFEGGEGPATQEAQFVTGLQEQSRQQLLPQLQQFGGQVLGMTGLVAPQIGLGEYGQLQASAFGAQERAREFGASFGLQQRSFEAELFASQQQTDFARRQYDVAQQELQEFKRRQYDPYEEAQRQLQSYRAQALISQFPQMFPGLTNFGGGGYLPGRQPYGSIEGGAGPFGAPI